MSSLSKEAAPSTKPSVARGLETPLRPPVQDLDNETRKRLIAGHMTDIMELLNLDLSDDSLMETPHRIAKCTSTKFSPAGLRQLPENHRH